MKRPDGEVYVIDYGLSLAPRPDGVVREATPENSWNARVAIVDLTNARAYDWFQDLHRPLLRMGVDVFKTDFGEDIPADALFSNGQTGATMHNLYPLLYNSAVCRGDPTGARVHSCLGACRYRREPTYAGVLVG